jgi:hypothetical protein
MPKVFTEWTVLQHDPIEKITPNLWRVRGFLGRIQRQMVMARMDDGRVLVHNAVALADEQMRELEAWGEPAFLFVPNAYHRQDARIWKDRYPRAQVVAPPAAKKRVEKVVPVDLTSDALPQNPSVRLVPLDGLPAESLLEVRSEGDFTPVFCDAIFNLPKVPLPMNLMLGPTGRVAAPRFARWFFVKDKRAFVAHLERLAQIRELRRVLVGHGRPITNDPATALQGVARQLRK